jgi:hypothetical protein
MLTLKLGLAPIALYPDTLLAQLLPAATLPPHRSFWPTVICVRAGT